MDQLTWGKISERYGRFEAELLKTYFEAQGVPVILFQESVSAAYPFTVGPLARVQVFVPKEKLDLAQALLATFERGDADMEIAEDISENKDISDE